MLLSWEVYSRDMNQGCILSEKSHTCRSALFRQINLNTGYPCSLALADLPHTIVTPTKQQIMNVIELLIFLPMRDKIDCKSKADMEVVQ